jgi:hypothetical protein
MEKKFKKYLKIVRNNKDKTIFMENEDDVKLTSEDKKILAKNKDIINLAIKNSIFLQYEKPSLDFEMDELKRTSETLNIDFEELVKKFNESELSPLSDSDWQKMQNTDSYKIKSINSLMKLLKKYGRDANRLINIFNKIANEKKIEAPMVLYMKNKKPYLIDPYLIGGNTRLSVIKILSLKNKKLKNPLVLKIFI